MIHSEIAISISRDKYIEGGIKGGYHLLSKEQVILQVKQVHGIKFHLYFSYTLDL